MNHSRLLNLNRVLLLCLVCVLVGNSLGGSPVHADDPDQLPYEWHTVRIGGGSPAANILVHPVAKDVAYLRTAAGNLYRWDADQEHWRALLDWVPLAEWWLGAAESVAVAPREYSGQTVYAALGKTYDAGPGDVVRSFDGGATWEFTGLNVLIGANEPGELQRGERLGVDPNNAEVVYYASAQDGLWRSTAQAAPGSWEQISPINGNFITFDKVSGAMGTPRRTRILYLGNEQDGIYRSEDGGTTWELLPTSPISANKAVVAVNGTLFVTHDRGVARFLPAGRGAGRIGIDTWEDISPEQGVNFVALTLEPTDFNHLLVARYTPEPFEKMYASEDGGITWEAVNIVPAHQLVWTPRNYFAYGITGLAFDPFQPGAVWMADQYYAWHTADIAATETTLGSMPGLVIWKNRYAGHEGMISTGALISPPEGRFRLLTGVEEHGGFENMRLDQSSELPALADRGLNADTITGVAFRGDDANFIARVGYNRTTGHGLGSYSTDGGVTYTPFEGVRDPQLASRLTGGRIAVAASSNLMQWVPASDAPPHYSTDYGTTWLTSVDAPSGVLSNMNPYSQPIAVDTYHQDLFYLYADGQFYRTTNNGTRWIKVSELPIVGQDSFVSVAAVPGREGDVWIGLGEYGLYQSSDAGYTFEQVSGVDSVRLLAFGKNPPDHNSPSVFLYGVVAGQEGIFRSDNMGLTWGQIDTPEVRLGMLPNSMVADRLEFGRVYIGTAGNGFYYGDRLPFEDVAAAFEVSVPALADDGALVVPLTFTPPIIDGTTDRVWLYTEPVTPQNLIVGRIADDADLTATFQAMYDFENLYLLVTVTDESLVVDSEYTWQDDSVEVYLDGGGERGNLYDFNDEQYVFRIHEQAPYTLQGNWWDVEFATLETITGYQIEIKIPWLNVGVFPADGLEVGFDLHINDDDAGFDRDTKLTWSATDDNAWRDPGLFGVLRISGEMVEQ